MLPKHLLGPFSGGNLYDKINQQKGQLFSEEVCGRDGRVITLSAIS